MTRSLKWLPRTAALAATTATVVATFTALTKVSEAVDQAGAPTGSTKAHTAAPAVAAPADAVRMRAAGAPVTVVAAPRVPPQPRLIGRVAQAPVVISPDMEGGASWYAFGFEGYITAGGEAYDPSDLTAAHKWLPFGTRVRVTNTVNGSSVVVRINDRGPFVGGRIIDVSSAAADALDMKGEGVVPVTLEILG